MVGEEDVNPLVSVDVGRADEVEVLSGEEVSVVDDVSVALVSVKECEVLVRVRVLVPVGSDREGVPVLTESDGEPRIELRPSIMEDMPLPSSSLFPCRGRG